MFKPSKIYPIENLPDATTIGNVSKTLMELVVDEYGNNVYSNKQATLKAFGDYLISSHPIFNKLDEIYNERTSEYDHSSDIYLGGQIHFLHNPESQNKSGVPFSKLDYAQTIRKDQLEDFIHENGLEVETITHDMKCMQCVVRGEWKQKPLRYTEISAAPLEFPATKCKVRTPLFNDTLYARNVIRMPKKGSFVTVVGKVKVPANIHDPTTPYYTPEKNLWAGALYINNLIAITELHNFKNDIAYFSMQFPTANLNFKVSNPTPGGPDIYNTYQRIRIVLPFKPADIVQNDEDMQSQTDIFKNIPVNAVALFYYES